MNEITIYDQFDDEPLQKEPSIEKEYICSDYTISSGFTLLMKLVLLTRKNKKAFSLAKKLINKNPNIINQKNDKGWTALILASMYSNYCSTEDIVKMLIDAEADLNLRDNNGLTILDMINDYNDSSTEYTVKLLTEVNMFLNNSQYIKG